MTDQCVICGSEHEPHCEGWMVPDWVLGREQEDYLSCGVCGSRPYWHIHAPYCGGSYQQRHHAWEPRPGSLAAAYAESLR